MLAGNADEPVTINALDVDFATGGGTIRNVDFAEAGRMNVENLNGTSSQLPYTFENCTNLGNLANWSLYVNGKSELSKKITVNGNKASVVSAGTIITIR